MNNEKAISSETIKMPPENTKNHGKSPEPAKEYVVVDFKSSKTTKITLSEFKALKGDFKV